MTSTCNLNLYITDLLLRDTFLVSFKYRFDYFISFLYFFILWNLYAYLKLTWLFLYLGSLL